MVVVDIWGGENSSEHVARFHRTMKKALELAARELEAGFLVNLRQEAAWGPKRDFDKRLIN